MWGELRRNRSEDADDAEGGRRTHREQSGADRSQMTTNPYEPLPDSDKPFQVISEAFENLGPDVELHVEKA